MNWVKIFIVSLALVLSSCGLNAPAQPTIDVSQFKVTILAPSETQTPEPIATPVPTDTSIPPPTLTPQPTIPVVDTVVNVPSLTPPPIVTDTPEPTATRNAPTKVPVNSSSGGNNLLELHNQTRAQQGLSPYAVSQMLTQAAQTQADFLAAKPQQELFTIGNGGHKGANGSTYQQRIAATGYAAKETNESWAYQASVAECFGWWMGEGARDHVPQIVSKSLSQVGFGLAKHTSGGIICVAVYAAPR
jgi:uncharacterized protein YkwD